MRYPASEKLEIIHLVERSHLPVQRTLDKLGIPTTTFYRGYDRYRAIAGMIAIGPLTRPVLKTAIAVPAGAGTVEVVRAIWRFWQRSLGVYRVLIMPPNSY